MVNAFEVLVSNLNDLGIFGFLLPWMLMFAIVFGALSKTKLFGDDKRIAGTISLVVAFFTVGFGGPILGNFFVGLFGIASMVLATILVVVLFVTMAGGDLSKLMESKALVALVAGISLIVVVAILGSLTGIRISNDTIAILFIIVIMGISVYFIAGK